MLFSILCAAWIGWVVYSFQGAAPGLLDDGIHMLVARSFQTAGFFQRLWIGMEHVWHGTRFYETQFAYLGVCWLLFHNHLAGWYAANLFLNLACALGALIFLFQAGRDKIAGTLSAAMILTSSPVAEAVRAGFGKAEAIMAMFFITGICVWHWLAIRRKSRAGLLFAALLILLGCVSKESGNLLALSLIAPSLLVGLFRLKAPRNFHSLALMGMVGLIGNYLVFLPSKRKAYISNYFAMDFSLGKVKQSALFYVREMPDVLLLAAVLVLIYAIVFYKAFIHGRKEPRVGGMDHGLLAIGLSFFLFATAYMVALLGFRFNLVYYAYLPAALLSVSAGIGLIYLGGIRPAAAKAMLAIFFLTRIYSVGYLFFSTGSQRLIDETNFEALETSKQFGAKRLFLVDVSDSSQIIQEWNCLRLVLKEPDVPVLIGSAPDFKAWDYQDTFRRFTVDNAETSYFSMNQESSFQNAKWHDRMPEAGDLLACRSGNIRVGYHFLRSGVPFNQTVDYSLATLDKSALTEVASVESKRRLFNPNTFKRSRSNYGWKIYRVNRPFAYSISGREGDGWMNPSSAVEVRNAAACPHIRLEIEVPDWLPKFPMHVSASSGEESLASVTFDGPGRKTLDIPVKQPGQIQLHADVWGRPKPPDTRELSYRMLEAASAL